jgi:gamma-butyrobetaine dioxygenase
VAANLTTSWDGQIDMPLAALRDRCGCHQCRHPSGQRLLDPAAIPVDLQLGDVTVDGDVVRVVWLPEGHHSVYSMDDLMPRQTSNEEPTLWDAGAAAMLPLADYAAITGDDPQVRRNLLRWLIDVDGMGCGLLRGVPTADGEVARVAELFGHIRETNYGRWFDVRAVVDPTNLANSSLGLAAHTDNPYRDPVPTMQLLHCLESTAAGGDNFLVDGWRVAEEVRAAQPAGFKLLAERAVTFRYSDATAELRTTATIVELDSEGSVRGVRFNPRSMQDPSMATDDLAAWYEGYLLFARLVADPRFHIRFRLDPGDLFVVDNRRVLHGRTAFEATSGTRHLQGCYADVDGLRSTIAVLSREGST